MNVQGVVGRRMDELIRFSPLNNQYLVERYMESLTKKFHVAYYRQTHETQSKKTHGKHISSRNP